MPDALPILSPSDWVARLASVPLVRVAISVRLERGIALSAPVCSVVRGLLGERLRDLRCQTRAPRCDGCVEFLRCDYASIFEAQRGEQRQGPADGVHAFWLQGIPAASDLPGGTEFRAQLVVAGHAIQAIAYLDVAFRDALARLGRARGSGARAAVVLSASAIERVAWASPRFPVAADTVRIETLTPLLLRGDLAAGARLAPGTPAFGLFVRAAVRRVDALVRAFFPQAPAARFAFPCLADAEVLGDKPLAEWRSSRFSQRQRRRLSLAGVTGALVVRSAALAELVPLLVAATVVSVGKATTMGFGNVSLEIMGRARDEPRGRALPGEGGRWVQACLHRALMS